MSENELSTQQYECQLLPQSIHQADRMRVLQDANAIDGHEQKPMGLLKKSRRILALIAGADLIRFEGFHQYIVEPPDILRANRLK